MSRRRITEALLNDNNSPAVAVEISSKNKMVKLPTVQLSEKNNSVFSTKRQMVYSVSPEECKPWSFHDRDQSWLTEKKCSDLIASIKLNGQKIPVLARAITHTNEKEKYEIIAGARRWFACKYLGTKLDITLTDSNNRECSVFMHIENKERDDISDFERATNYKSLLESSVFESQDSLGLSFGVKKSALSKMLSAATLSEYKFIFDHLESITQIPIKPAYELSVLLKDKTSFSKIKQHMNSLKKRKRMPSVKSILKELLQVGKGTITHKENIIIHETPSKKSRIILRQKKNILFLEFPAPKQKKETEEIKNLLASMIDQITNKDF